MQQGKKGNIQEQARRRANVSQIVKNPFDYHQSYLEKTEKQDWKQIGNLFPVWPQILYVTWGKSVTVCSSVSTLQEIPSLFSSTRVWLWFLIILLSISLEVAFYFNQICSWMTFWMMGTSEVIKVEQKNTQSLSLMIRMMEKNVEKHRTVNKAAG